jgi:DNA-binding MarR family transcriptional regulator
MQNKLSVEEQVILAIRRITRAVDLHSNFLERNFGLTGPQLTTLRVVNRLQPVSAGVLAATANISPATLSGILIRLEVGGFLTRTRDPGDRRIVILTLTTAGKRILDTAPSLLSDHFRRELGKLPDSESGRLLNALGQVASLMEADITGKIEAENPAPASRPGGHSGR